MFSLAIYDTLTPGSLTGGEPGRRHRRARLGRHRRRRSAASSRRSPAPARTGAELFLVPAGQLRRTPRRPQRRHAAGQGDDLRRPLRRGRGLGQGPRRRPAELRDHRGDGMTASLDPLGSLDADPALAAAVLEIESHIAEGGWDQPRRLYALVPTADLVRREPDARRGDGARRRVRRGLAHPGRAGPAAARPAPRGRADRDRLAAEVAGCAAVVERLVLPPDADGAVPDDAEAAEQFAREHPDRQEVRIVAGVTRAGSTYCRPAPARARRRPVGGRRRRPGARADHPPGVDPGQ